MTTNLRLTQGTLETASTGAPKLRVTQGLLESAALNTTASTHLRVTQAFLEVAQLNPPPGVRLTQAMIEFCLANPATIGAPGWEVGLAGLTFPNMQRLQGWSLHRRPTWATRLSTSASGREVRAPSYVTPFYEFELTYEVLNASTALGGAFANSLQLIMGFFQQCQGQYASFLFTDPDFNTITGGSIGTGTGGATGFTLQRTIGGYSEAVGWTNAVTAVYINGVAQSGGTWSLTQPNTISFITPPALGAAITADFTYYFACRFVDDIQDFEEWARNLHSLKSCKFRSVRTS